MDGKPVSLMLYLDSILLTLLKVFWVKRWKAAVWWLCCGLISMQVGLSVH